MPEDLPMANSQKVCRRNSNGRPLKRTRMNLCYLIPLYLTGRQEMTADTNEERYSSRSLNRQMRAYMSDTMSKNVATTRTQSFTSQHQRFTFRYREGTRGCAQSPLYLARPEYPLVGQRRRSSHKSLDRLLCSYEIFLIVNFNPWVHRSVH
jgi:hypothetical protein